MCNYLIEEVVKPSKNRVGISFPESHCTFGRGAWWCEKWRPSSPGAGLWRAVGGRKLAVSGIEPEFGSLRTKGNEPREREKDEAATIQVQKFINQNFVSNGSRWWQQWQLIKVWDSRNDLAFLLPDLS